MRRSGRMVGAGGGTIVFDYEPAMGLLFNDAGWHDRACGFPPNGNNGTIFNTAPNVGITTRAPVGIARGYATQYNTGRMYFGNAGQMVINEREDFTISAWVTTDFNTTPNRAFFCGPPQSNGSNGTFAMGHTSGGLWQIAFAPGAPGSTGANLNWTGPSHVGGYDTPMRMDLVRCNGCCFAFFNGQPPSAGSAQGAADTGSHIPGGKFALGGVGEYTGDGLGGTYGERWKGTIERFVIIKGAGLFTAPFNPYTEQPFMRQRR